MLQASSPHLDDINSSRCRGSSGRRNHALTINDSHYHKPSIDDQLQPDAPQQPARRVHGAPAGTAPRAPAASQLEPRSTYNDDDAHHRIKYPARSLELEEESSAGPACLGPHIRIEPFPTGFRLPRDTPKYNGTTKPKDWLIDYTTAIGVAGGNWRLAMRYASLMLRHVQAGGPAAPSRHVHSGAQ